MQIIGNVTVYFNEYSCLENGGLEFAKGKVTRILTAEEMTEIDQDAEVIDGKGLYLLPGFIDVHVHGGYGYDFLEQPAEARREFSRQCVREGCTAYLASLVSGKHDKLIKAMKQYRKLDGEGARCLGIHMEGPYLSREYKAVMDPATLRMPDMQEFRELIEASNGHIVSMTIAPDLPQALELIEYGSQHGISMMLGHSGANSEQGLAAINRGAVGLTHMYNAMSQHLHRTPGLVTLGLADDRVMCELICDGFHVHPDVVKATINNVGSHVALITDASLMKGLPDGDYIFSNNDVHKEGIKAQVKETGRIAGSVIGLDDAVRNVVSFTGCSLNDIVRMACVNPAKIARCSEHKGRLLPGYDADFILLDQQLNVRAAFVEGRECFNEIN